MTIRCPDYVSGVCQELNCRGILENPREDGRDENLNSTFTAICTRGGHLQYFHKLHPEIEQVKPDPVTISKPEVEVLDSTALVPASDNQLPANLFKANPALKFIAEGVAATYQKIEEQGKVLNRVYDQGRSRTVAHDEKVERWAKENRLLEIFEDYQKGKYGPNLNPKGKRAVKDLLVHEKLGPMIERDFGINTLKPLETAINNARVRKRNAENRRKTKRKK